MKFNEITFSDNDVVNPGDFIPAGEYNPHNVRPFLLHDHGFCLCIVFANCLRDALDIAADAGKLDRFAADADEQDREDLAYLGNASEPFDIESLDWVELPNPRFSFVALLNSFRST